MITCTSRPGGAGILILCTAVCLTALGCGPSLIKPKGRVMQGGEPFPVKKGHILGIAFYPITEEGRPGHDEFYGSIKPEDTAFYVVGRKGKGIPPGKYRITVALMKGTSQKDLWNGKFGKEKSPFDFNLTDDKEELLIDLPREKF